jgi:hypothetical protein
MTTKNIPLMRKVLEFMVNNSDQIDMNNWWREDECGTVGCIAGWTCQLTGYRVNTLSPAQIVSFAMTELGLSHYEAEDLFYSGDLTEALELVEEMTNGEIRADEFCL